MRCAPVFGIWCRLPITGSRGGPCCSDLAKLFHPNLAIIRMITPPHKRYSKVILFSERCRSKQDGSELSCIFYRGEESLHSVFRYWSRPNMPYLERRMQSLNRDSAVHLESFSSSGQHFRKCVIGRPPSQARRSLGKSPSALPRSMECLISALISALSSSFR